ncbi:MAG: L,D-transpeptidase ErfK/SrfK [Paracoccaceae bacterium]|jgi:L,D-transpeptidase ErfK/SrfK
MMTTPKSFMLNRRSMLAGAASLVAAPTLAQTAQSPHELVNSSELPEPTSVKNNISSFRELDWEPYFTSTEKGMILVDTVSRALHFWSEDLSIYRLYPSSVPVSADLTRLGRTKVIKKVDGPTWSPTPAMKERNPEWPDFIPAGPDNPLGTHALYLSWQFYRIHGTHDTRKIGRRSSSGCVGLYNEHISELFGFSKVGTQVLLI